MSSSEASIGVEAARAALDACPIPQIRRLEIEAIGDSLLISGRVESFYLKQRAQETLRGVVRDRRVVNQVVVETMEGPRVNEGSSLEDTHDFF